MPSTNSYMFNNMEDEPIKVEVDGITYLSTGRYYEGINNLISHDL